MIKKYFKLLICIVFFVLLSAGCSAKKEEIVEITLIHGWGNMEADHEAMRKIYKDFEEEHPEIRINLISMPSSTDVISKVGDLLTVGQIPDIVFTGGDGRESVYDFMVKKECAIDLYPYIEEDVEFQQNISPSILNYWMTEEGQLYTVSDVLLMSGGYWYNVDLFEQAGIENYPKTWDEFVDACKKLQAYGLQENIQLNPLFLDAENVVYMTDAIISDLDINVLEQIENNNINLKSDVFVETVQRLEKIAEYSDIVDAYSFRDALLSFNECETAIYINGVWANSMINTGLNVKYAPFPSEEGTDISAISSCVGYILGNTNDQKRMDASVEFIKYMLSDDVSERILRETGQIPSNPNLEITDSNGSRRLYQAVSCVKNAELIIEAPANLWNTKSRNQFGENVIKYLKGEISYSELQMNIDS